MRIEVESIRKAKKIVKAIIKTTGFHPTVEKWGNVFKIETPLLSEDEGKQIVSLIERGVNPSQVWMELKPDWNFICNLR